MSTNLRAVVEAFFRETLGWTSSQLQGNAHAIDDLLARLAPVVQARVEEDVAARRDKEQCDFAPLVWRRARDAETDRDRLQRDLVAAREEVGMLRAALLVARRHVASSSDAEHMLDGFGPRTRRPSDTDLAIVDEALVDDAAPLKQDGRAFHSTVGFPSNQAHPSPDASLSGGASAFVEPAAAERVLEVLAHEAALDEIARLHDILCRVEQERDDARARAASATARVEALKDESSVAALLYRVLDAYDVCDNNRGAFSCHDEHDLRCPKSRADAPEKWKGDWVCECGREELDAAVEAARNLRVLRRTEGAALVEQLQADLLVATAQGAVLRAIMENVDEGQLHRSECGRWSHDSEEPVPWTYDDRQPCTCGTADALAQPPPAALAPLQALVRASGTVLELCDAREDGWTFAENNTIDTLRDALGHPVGRALGATVPGTAGRGTPQKTRTRTAPDPESR